MPCSNNNNNNNNNNHQDASRNETESSNYNVNQNSNGDDNDQDEEESPPPSWRSRVLLPPPLCILGRMGRPSANMTPEEQIRRSRVILDEALAIVHGDRDPGTRNNRSHRRTFPPIHPKQ